MRKQVIDIERLPVGGMKTNAYLVSDRDSSTLVVVDPGDDAQYLMDHVSASGKTPAGILLTHGHFDHCIAAFELQVSYGIPVYLQKLDQFLIGRLRETASRYLGYAVVEPPPRIDRPLDREKTLDIGSLHIGIIACPGHTPGSLSYRFGNSVLTGDTVFADGLVGEWNHAYSSKTDLTASVNRILALPSDTVLYPGHGEETTVGRELAFREAGGDVYS
jgi:hydroxyacylglutathione hydrolase